MRFSQIATVLAISALAATPALAQQYGNQGYSNGYGQNPGYNNNYGQNQGYNNNNGNQMGQQSGPLSQGMIQRLQEKLRSVGIYQGNIDGVWGPETQDAVRTFQQRNGLRANGMLNYQTLSSLDLVNSGGGQYRQQ